MNSSRITISGNEARQKILEGAEHVEEAVGATMGPKGKNVVIYRDHGRHKYTKDGVSVAKELRSADTLKQIGINAVLTAANDTCREAGDGTTTVSVLTHAILKKGINFIATGCDGMLIQKGLQLGAGKLIEALQELSIPLDKKRLVKKVAALSANNDDFVGGLVAQAVERVGKDATVIIKDSKNHQTCLEIVEGMSIDQGMCIPQFSQNALKAHANYKDVNLFLTNHRFLTAQSMENFLINYLQNYTDEPLIIIAEEFEHDAVAVAANNFLNGMLDICLVRAPFIGPNQKHAMDDIAAVSDGTVYDKNQGTLLSNFDLSTEEHRALIGKVAEADIYEQNTILAKYKGKGKGVDERLAFAQSQLVIEKDNRFMEEEIKQRIAKLKGGVATIYVGGHTKEETGALRDLVDDSVRATISALEEGVVTGGGTALIRARDSVDWSFAEDLDKGIKDGIEILKYAIESPFRRILTNAGLEPGEHIGKIKAANKMGLDVRTEKYVNLFNKGILDPTKVERCALTYAVSTAGMVLTSEVAILPEDGETSWKPTAGNTAGLMNR